MSHQRCHWVLWYGHTMNSSKVKLPPYKLQARGSRIEKLDPWFNTPEQENIGSRSKSGIMDYHQRWYKENINSRPQNWSGYWTCRLLNTKPTNWIGLDQLQIHLCKEEIRSSTQWVTGGDRKLFNISSQCFHLNLHSLEPLIGIQPPIIELNEHV